MYASTYVSVSQQLVSKRRPLGLRGLAGSCGVERRMKCRGGGPETGRRRMSFVAVSEATPGIRYCRIRSQGKQGGEEAGGRRCLRVYRRWDGR